MYVHLSMNSKKSLHMSMCDYSSVKFDITNVGTSGSLQIQKLNKHNEGNSWLDKCNCMKVAPIFRDIGTFITTCP